MDLAIGTDSSLKEISAKLDTSLSLGKQQYQQPQNHGGVISSFLEDPGHSSAKQQQQQQPLQQQSSYPPHRLPPMSRPFGFGFRGGVGAGAGSSRDGVVVEGYTAPPRWENQLPTIKSDGSLDNNNSMDNSAAASLAGDSLTGEYQQSQQQQQQQQPYSRRPQQSGVSRLFLGSGVAGIQRRSSPAGYGGGGGDEETPPRTPTSLTALWNNAAKGLGFGGGGREGSFGKGTPVEFKTRSGEKR